MDVDTLIKTEIRIKKEEEYNNQNSVVLKIKYAYFNLVHLLIKNKTDRFLINCLFIITQFLQIISFCFSTSFESFWSFDYYPKAREFIHFFQVIPLFEDNDKIIFLMLEISAIYVVLLISLVIYLSYKLSKLQLKNKACILLLDIFFSSNSSLFLPIMKIFIDFANCNSRESKKILSISCFEGRHLIYSVIGILLAFLYLIISAVIEVTFYEYRSLSSLSSSKLTALTSLELLAAKLVLIIMYEFIPEDKSILSLFTFCISFYILYDYLKYQPYYNQHINRLYIIMYYMFTWSSFIVVIDLIFEDFVTKGSLPLLLVGYVAIIFGVFVKSFKFSLDSLLKSESEIKNPTFMLTKIKFFLSLVDHLDTYIYRTDNVYLFGYIKFIEDFCPLKECALKQYFSERGDKKEFTHKEITSMQKFLYQHGEAMYKAALRKFPTDIKLRISYGVFLFDKLQKKQKGLREIDDVEKYDPNFEESFLVFRCKKLVNDQMEEELKVDDMDYVSALAYKGYVNSFKSCIIKVSTCYIEFWTLLNDSNDDNRGENFEKMSNLGNQINNLVKEINLNFEKIESINKNEPEVLKLYSEFLNDILFDSAKSEFYQKKLSEIEDQKHKFDENNIITMNYKALSQNEEYKFIVASGQNDKFGMIVNVSMTVCSIFGFTKEDLVGQSINTIIPDIYCEDHNNILQKKQNEFKKDPFFQKERKIHFKEFYAYGKTKSKYIIPSSFKSGIVATEEGDIFFIAQLVSESTKNFAEIDYCYILTDMDFIIQNFTSNAVQQMNLNSNGMNKSIEITDYIKEFNEELLNTMLQNNNDHHNDHHHNDHHNDHHHNGHDNAYAKRNAKISIVEQKFRSPKEITWLLSDNCDSSLLKVGSGINKSKLNFQKEAIKMSAVKRNSICVGFGSFPLPQPGVSLLQHQPKSLIPNNPASFFNNRGSSLICSGIQDSNRGSEDKFYLEVLDVKIGGKQIGFVFKFIASVAYNSQYKPNETILSPGRIGESIISACKESFIGLKDGRLPDCFSRFRKNKEPDYIPKLNPMNDYFNFDISNLSFKTGGKEAQQKLRDMLKDMVIDRMTEGMENEESEEQSDTSGSYSSSGGGSESFNSSYTGSENDSRKIKRVSSSIKSKKPPSISKEQRISMLSTIMKTHIGNIEKGIEDYYHVNFDPISLFIYDYKKGRIEKQENYKKTSKVEYYIGKEHPNENTEEETPNDSKTVDDSNSLNNTNNSMKSLLKSNEVFIHGKSIEHEEKSKTEPVYSEKEILINQISIALQNREPQKSVIKLAMVTILLFISMIGITIMILSFFLQGKKTVVKYINLILQTFDYNQNLIYSIHSVREITILAFPQYVNQYYEKNEYKTILDDTALKNFESNMVILEQLSATFNSLSEKERNTFTNTLINMTRLDGLDKTKTKLMSMIPALIENNMALYHLYYLDYADEVPLNENVLFFLRNSLNSIMKTAGEQSKIFSEKFFEETNTLKKTYIYIIIASSCYYILSWFVLIYFYEKVEARKQSYLTVFYEIGKQFIITTLAKCEKFSQKIQIKNELDSESLSSEDPNLIEIEKQKIKKRESIKAESAADIIRKRRKKKKICNYIKNKLVFLLVVFIYAGFSFAILLNRIFILNNYDMVVRYIYHHGNYQNEYLMLLPSVRELIFEPNNRILDTLVGDYIEEKLDSFYITVKEEYGASLKHLKYMPTNYQKFFSGLRIHNLCPYATEYFVEGDPERDCHSFFFSTMKDGMKAVFTSYVEELHDLVRKYYDLQRKWEKYGLVYNNTAFGRDELYNKTLPSEDKKELWDKYHPISIYNLNQHKDLCILFIFVMKKIFLVTSNNLMNEVTLLFNKNNTLSNVLIYLLIGVQVIIFMFLLAPFEVKLNETIYKAKSMLSIIPKEVLATLNQIKVLLEIDQKTKKKKKKK